MLPDDEEHIRRLNPALLPFLEAELAAGNQVVETWRGWPEKESLYVMLARPFLVACKSLPDGITKTDLDDPHYWKAEYKHKSSGHVIACRFSHAELGAGTHKRKVGSLPVARTLLKPLRWVTAAIQTVLMSGAALHFVGYILCRPSAGNMTTVSAVITLLAGLSGLLFLATFPLALAGATGLLLNSRGRLRKLSWLSLATSAFLFFWFAPIPT